MSKNGFLLIAAVLLLGSTAFNYSLSNVDSGGGRIYSGTRTGSGSSGWHK